MKIGIHHTNDTFSVRWISYCEENGIDYKLVDCYRSDIILQLSDCDALLWHFNHKSPRASKFAKQLLYSIEVSGKKVFPDFNTVWHFDDKLGQKYLLEAINAPLAPSYVFYSQRLAESWTELTTYPIVFKLRNGAGSDNVRLVKSKYEAKKLIRIAFGRGFRQYQSLNNLKERYRKYKLGKLPFWSVIKGIIRLFYTTDYDRISGREKGYIYFQDFIPGNNYDIRIIVIGDKAFAIKRLVRKNDFRASGSGFILYEKEHFDNETIRIAFAITDKIKAQCLAYDFVYSGNEPLIVEISYGFAPVGYDNCAGYWDKKLTWHPGRFNPYGWMIDNICKAIQ